MSVLRFLTPVLLLAVAYSPDTFAEGPSSEGLEYRENYRFSLRYQMAEGEDVTIEFVVSAKSFEVATFEPRLKFSGSVLSTEKDNVVLQYDLRLEREFLTPPVVRDGQSPFQTVAKEQGGLRSNVRLKLGSPVEILAVGNARVQLVVSKVN